MILTEKLKGNEEDMSEKRNLLAKKKISALSIRKVKRIF